METQRQALDEGGSYDIKRVVSVSDEEGVAGEDSG
jgi:hypothetical protein